MTYKEALDYLLIFFSDATDEEYYQSEVFIQALDLAVTALGKQVAKGMDRAGIKGEEYSCPSCGLLYWDEYDIDTHCSSCGQKLMV